MASKNISIKKIITIIFIISLLASTTLIGYIIFLVGYLPLKNYLKVFWRRQVMKFMKR